MRVGGGGSYASYSVVFVVVEGCDGEHFVEELGVGRHFGGGLLGRGGSRAVIEVYFIVWEISQGMGEGRADVFPTPLHNA